MGNIAEDEMLLWQLYCWGGGGGSAKKNDTVDGFLRESPDRLLPKTRDFFSAEDEIVGILLKPC